jgi:hypothetical protein
MRKQLPPWALLLVAPLFLPWVLLLSSLPWVVVRLSSPLLALQVGLVLLVAPLLVPVLEVGAVAEVVALLL